MSFKPGDVCVYTGFKEEKLRYWRRTLSPLKKKKGNVRCFSHHDLVCLLTLDRLMKSLGGNIGEIRPLAADVFRCCKQQSDWTQLRHYTLLIQPDNKKKVSLELRAEFEPPLDAEFYVVIQLAGPVDYLLGKLTKTTPQPMPPLTLFKARQKRRRA